MSDVCAASIVVTGQMVVTALQADGLQACPADAWAYLRADLEPHGFSWEDGQLRIPGDLVAWWADALAGRGAVAWPR